MNTNDDQIFLSYSREESSRVEALVNYLTDVGFQVFWDPKVDDFSKWKDVLEAKLNQCDVIIVCWSGSAIQSEWVKWEAEIAKRSGKYLPITLDGDRPDFDSKYQIRSLRNWNSLIRPRAAQMLARAIVDRLEDSTKINVKKVLERIEDLAKARQLSITWFILSFVTIYYALSSWIASQNDGYSPLGFLINGRPVQESIISIVLVSVLAGIAYRILNYHIMFHRGEPWMARLPRSFSSPRNASDSLVRRFAYAKLLGAVFPVLAIIHFADDIWGDGAVARCDKYGVIVPVDPWVLPDIRDLIGHVFCFGEGIEDAARGGVTFLPFIEPIVIIVLCGWVAFEITRACINLFRR